MSNISPFVRPRIIHFQEQPSFPQEDLLHDNADYLSQQLDSDAGLATMSQELFDAQLGLYQVAMATEPLGDMYCENSQASYEAFISGFATFRAIAKAVGSETYVEPRTLGIRNTTEMLLAPYDGAPAKRMAIALANWRRHQPNTQDTVIELHPNMPLRHLHAATMGAATAYKLSLPA